MKVMYQLKSWITNDEPVQISFISILDVRNNERCILDSVEKANMIWERIKDYIPDIWKHPRLHTECQVVGLNERLRFLKYGPGEYFAPHQDGKYVRPDGSEESFITIQLYLNEGFEGGNTTFMSLCNGENVGVVPKIGRVLVFQHDITHEGSLLVQGTKYSMRTDIMYKSGDLEAGANRDPYGETISSPTEVKLQEKSPKERKKSCILM